MAGCNVKASNGGAALHNGKTLNGSTNGFHTGACSANGRCSQSSRNELKLEEFYPNCRKPDPDSSVGRHLDKIYSSSYGDWLLSFGLRPSWEVPVDSLEIHIWHGYRPNPTSLLYCFKSAFIPSNETLNVWTHLIPCLYMIYRAFSTFTVLTQPTDVMYWPLWVNFFGCIYILAASSFAHLFSCKSTLVQEFSYCLDYGAISCYGLTTFISNLTYVYPSRCFVTESIAAAVILWAACILALLVHTMSCASRWEKCPSRFVVRYCPSIVCYTISMFPVLVRCWRISSGTIKDHDDEFCARNNEGFLQLAAFCILMLHLATVMVGTRFPEKYYPGTFDIIGHSHQLFHIFSACAMISQHAMVERAMIDMLQHDTNRLFQTKALAITEWTTVYPLIFYVLVSMIVLYKFAIFLGEKLERRRLDKVKRK